jgi:hypothetical protein
VLGPEKLTLGYRIGNMVHSAFVAEFFGIPLRSRGGGPDSYTEETLAEALGDLFAYVFLDLDTAQSMKNLVVAKRHTEKLGQVMQAVVSAAKSRHLPYLMQLIWPEGPRGDLSSYGTKLIDRLLEADKSVDNAVWTLIPTAAAASATQAQAVCAALPVIQARFLSRSFDTDSSFSPLLVGPDDRFVPL